MEAQRFSPNCTNKVHYGDVLRTRAENMRSFSKTNPKEKSRLEIIDLIIYLSCDGYNKFKILEKET